ncbi:uncharacterized protein LOC111264285 isoform X2 [Varroa jacobsoni]|uniref:uncharacterized protein LOC111264285 isoform X2 n=1 Tax=Varroa jacobsoni TaxID=62625 RepID=UPI000BF5AFC2|nr:uncharacterized protein LOC111264285 isoform X2 [Varroa jacobsoni]
MAEYLIEPVEEPLWDSVTLTRTTTPGTDADDTVMEEHLMRIPSAILQSTPLHERPPSLGALLPSAIKLPNANPVEAATIEDPNETIRGRGFLKSGFMDAADERQPFGKTAPMKPPRKSLLSRLSSIAERSFSTTPRKAIKAKNEQFQQELPLQTDLTRSDQNTNDGDDDQASDKTLTADSANEIDQVTDKKIDVEDQNNNNTQCTSQLYRHTDRGNGAASTGREDNEKVQSGPFETDTKKKMPSKAACDCKSCMAILEQEWFCDVPSEISCSLASLGTPHRSLPSNSGDRRSSHQDDFGQAAKEVYSDYSEQVLSSPPTEDIAKRPSQASSQNARIFKLNDGVRRIGKFLRSTLAAGERRLCGWRSSKETDGLSLASEISSTTKSRKAFWHTKRFTVIGQDTETTTTTSVPQLLKRAGRISISSDDYGLRSVQCDSPLSFHAPEKDSELHDASITSIMVVLMPSGAADPNEVDSRVWLSVTDSGEEGGDPQCQLIVRDPVLKNLLEDLKQVMVDQEIILKQTSKVLDECGRYMGCAKAKQGIVLAEQMLHVAMQRYFAAETELQWYIDGFEFEPQRDRVVVRELRIPLREEFRANVAASKDQFVFLVLLKVGHRVEASDVLWMAPDDREIVVKGLWSHGIFKGTGERPSAKNSALMAKLMTKSKRRSPPLWYLDKRSDQQRLGEGLEQTEETKANFEFTFNRSDWKVDIEIYSFFVKRARWNSSLNLNKRKVDRSNPSPQVQRRDSIRVDSERHIEVRKSSFGLLAKATLSKNDVLARRSVSLIGCPNPSPFESELRIIGEAHLNDTVYYAAVLNVKDFTGSFGRMGGMRSCFAKLHNTTLSFFESSPTLLDETKPLRTFDLSGLTVESLELDTIEGLFFHGFTLWLHNNNVQSNVSQTNREKLLQQTKEEFHRLKGSSSGGHENIFEAGSDCSLGPTIASPKPSATANLTNSEDTGPTLSSFQQPVEDCLRLCTNSREQTLLWIEHLRRALRQARVVELV